MLKSSFDHFYRSTLPPFDVQRIRKSSSNFFADVCQNNINGSLFDIDLTKIHDL